MGTATKPAGYANGRSTSLAVCLITDDTSLVTTLRAQLRRRFRLHVRSSLLDVLQGADCDAFILDGRVRDMALWPAPLLIDEELGGSPWAILLPATGTHGIEMVPPNSAVFPRNAQGIRQVGDYLASRMQAETQGRIEDVRYLDEQRMFLVHMANRRSYLLPLEGLAADNGAAVSEYRLSDDREYFTITLESGETLEVPWDTVLYHCEPTYEYFKGRQVEEDRATRIGRQVRDERLSRGMTISALAGLAGLQRTNVSRLEHGRHVPSLETLERLAKALGTRVVDLVADS